MVSEWIAYRIRWNVMWMRRQLAVIVLLSTVLGVLGLVSTLILGDSRMLWVLFGGTAMLGGALVVVSFVVRATPVKWWLTAAGLACTVIAFTLLFVVH